MCEDRDVVRVLAHMPMTREVIARRKHALHKLAK